eukprot:GHRR01035701.1.p1 GENE.GHRR01035701.1~~GHRR01035701.1.p1  ORF type:complete len:267 (+),score=123.45 GHRR01035701.1:919-1719(+)
MPACLIACLQHILPQQQLLDQPEHYKPLLRYIPDEEIGRELSEKWDAGGQGIVPQGLGAGRRSSTSAAAAAGTAGDSCCLSVRRWDELVKLVTEQYQWLRHEKQYQRANALEKCLSDILFAYSYPRLDVEVTKKMNHLLKAPFCVHPKTGKICVPIDPAAAWEFDPDDVPTVQQLVQEMAAVKQEQQEQQQGQGGGAGDDAAVQQQLQAGVVAEGWHGTSMEPFVQAFEKSFLAPLAASNRAALNDKAKEAAAEQRAQRDDGDLSW